MTNEIATTRPAALLTFIPALLSLVIVLHHPVLRHADVQNSITMVAGLSRIAQEDAIFHGGMLCLFTVQALGLHSFAERLGLSSLWVRAGILSYGLATILLFVAGIIDGFAVPLLGQGCPAAPGACAASLSGSLGFAWAAIQAFTKVALAVQAIGLLCWSIQLTRLAGWPRWLGFAGIVLASVPLVMLGTMSHAIGPVQLGEIIVAEALWAMAAAVVLWNGLLPIRSV